MQNRTNTWLSPHYGIVLLIFAATLAVYGPVTRFDFVAFDDMMYVTENPHVQNGLNAGAVMWAFRPLETEFSSYWQPLTWISHMIDVHVYGVRAGGHHLTNLLLHLLNAVLLYFFLFFSTHRQWRSLLVALLFALHPVNVETVAWVSARKNVLSTFFWLLTMLAYSGYARRPNFFSYITTLFCFLLGLMTKPMLITLPFVFLLMDYWPLGRLNQTPAEVTGSEALKPNGPKCFLMSVFRLLVEKIPFFVLSAATISLSSYLLRLYRTYIPIESVPFKMRIFNALVSYVRYAIKMVCPTNLSVYYPFPEKLPIWQVGGAVFFILVVSFWALRTVEKRPYISFGWFWYLGTLVPMAGLVQAGLWPAMADRWAYVPFVGLFILLVWGTSELAEKWRFKTILLAGSASIIIVALSAQTYRQLAYWRNSEALFQHAVKVTQNNAAMHANLANVMLDNGRVDAAVANYRKALEIKPDFSEAHHNYGLALIRQNEYDLAVEHLRRAIRLHPHYAQAFNSLGTVLLNRGKNDEAIEQFEQSIRLNPSNADVYNNLGLAYVRNGSIERSIVQFKTSIRIHPGSSAAKRNLQRSMYIKEKLDRLIFNLAQDLRTRPESAGLVEYLKQMALNREKLADGMKYYQKALGAQPGFSSDELRFENYPALSRIIQAYDRLYPLYQKVGAQAPDSPEACYYIACIYAVQNIENDAIAWLEKSIAGGFDDYSLVRNDKNLDNIRNTMAYQKLLAQIEPS